MFGDLDTLKDEASTDKGHEDAEKTIQMSRDVKKVAEFLQKTIREQDVQSDELVKQSPA